MQVPLAAFLLTVQSAGGPLGVKASPEDPEDTPIECAEKLHNPLFPTTMSCSRILYREGRLRSIVSVYRQTLPAVSERSTILDSWIKSGYLDKILIAVLILKTCH